MKKHMTFLAAIVMSAVSLAQAQIVPGATDSDKIYDDYTKLPENLKFLF